MVPSVQVGRRSRHARIIFLSQSPIKPVVLGAKAMRAIYMGTPTKVITRIIPVPEEGAPCLCRGCRGKMRIYYPDDRLGAGCTCFIAAPCGRCTNSAFECDTCLEDQGDVYDRLIHNTPFAQMPKHRRRRMIEKINKQKRQ